MQGRSFQPPWGDETLISDGCRLAYTDALSAHFFGGPPGWKAGRLTLTRSCLAFRAAEAERIPAAHRTLYGPRHHGPGARNGPPSDDASAVFASDWTLPRGSVLGAEVLGPEAVLRPELPGPKTGSADAETDPAEGAPRLRLRIRTLGPSTLDPLTLDPCVLGSTTTCDVVVSAPERWVALLSEPAPTALAPARDRLATALAGGETSAGRYVEVLWGLSFPHGDWHVERKDDMREVCAARLRELDIEETEALWRQADAIADAAAQSGDEAGRGRQIASVCEAVGRRGARCFRAYAPPADWPAGEPMWVWLSDDEDAALRQLGVVAPLTATLA
ncbi:MAG: hypothetical protein AAGN82_12435 [Myxococcota bacterium]